MVPAGRHAVGFREDADGYSGFLRNNVYHTSIERGSCPVRFLYSALK